MFLTLHLALFLPFSCEFKYRLLGDTFLDPQLGGADVLHTLKAPCAFVTALSDIHDYMVTGVVI